jgi:hypothetical protein
MLEQTVTLEILFSRSEPLPVTKKPPSNGNDHFQASVTISNIFSQIWY